jgi:hypothetical protein
MLKLDERFTVTIPQGTISTYGIYLIRSYITAQTLQAGAWLDLNPDNKLVFLPQPPDDWQWVWVVPQGEYAGTFPKRIRNYYYKVHGLKCPDEFVTGIGNIARRHSESNESYTFEFVNHFDWNAGDFGDRGSCYWGSNAAAKDMLRDNGGLAIRFYDANGNGYARAWLVEIEDGMFIIFNGYGFPSDSTLNIARIFALYMNLNYREIDLSNAYGDTLYINGGSGFVIGKTEQIEDMDSYEFEWEDYYSYYCEHCGEHVHEDDVYYGANDLPYCQSCFYELFDNCYRCGETYWQDEITYTADEQYICRYCLERHYVRCDHCGEFHRNGMIEVYKERNYCPECLEEVRQRKAG